MSVPIMRSTLALLTALVLMGACGDAAAQKDLDAARSAAAEAHTEAAAAADHVAALEARLDDLDAEITAAQKGRDRLASRLDKLGPALRKSLGRLRTALADLESGAASAEANAGEALSKASQIARDLAVLEQRYDYHLRRYHGGG